MTQYVDMHNYNNYYIKRSSMDGSRFIRCCILFLWVDVELIHCSQEGFYISPSLGIDNPCRQDTICLTFSEFAANSSHYLVTNQPNASLSLFFLPGNHTLDRELTLARGDRFSMTKTAQLSGSVYVDCVSESGRFNISNTNSVSIKGLHFIGCEGNSVTRVDQLTIEDTTFQGGEGRDRALVLSEVAIASIVRSKFFSNTYSSNIVLNKYYIAKYILRMYDFKLESIRMYLDTCPSGAALYIVSSSVTIDSCSFMNNKAEIGGALVAKDSSLLIVRSICSHNKAKLGGVMVTSNSTIITDVSTFSQNAAVLIGGVMISHRDIFTISSSSFTDNKAGAAGVVETVTKSSFEITNSTFVNNSATFGGVMRTSGESVFSIIHSNFTSNSATDFHYLGATLNSGGGVMTLLHKSLFNITYCSFIHNSASMGGAIEITSGVSAHIFHCTFINNRAKTAGAVLDMSNDLTTIINSTFTSNRAGMVGGAIRCMKGGLHIDNSRFNLNEANSLYGGIMFTLECRVHLFNNTFEHNSGSLYSFNSNVIFSGYTLFDSCVEPLAAGSARTRQEGGAITSFQSTVTFNGMCTLSRNQASLGGAVLATESTIIMYGETTIVNNMATNGSGGGISLRQSNLEVRGHCTISSNHAVRGGGIHATSSTIAVYQPGTLLFISNRAENGSGIYFETDPKLYVLKTKIGHTQRLKFIGNHAKYGGAVYVADDTNSGACSADNECFIQTLTLHAFNTLDIANIMFSQNTATEHGSDIYGGLLDRCIPSIFAEVYLKGGTPYVYNGITYLGNITNIALDSIASLPVRVCFCSTLGQPDCSYQPSPFRVKKGETFNMSLVAVDQVNHTVDANVISSLSSLEGGFGEGQQIQGVYKDRNCTNLTFSVFSPHESETINLYADGPCGSATLSTSHVSIQFVNCTCPVGFEPLSNNPSMTNCECVCDSQLSPHITTCNATTSLLQRINTNSWIAYVNDTDPPGYVIHLNCPFDYCHLPTDNVSINFNLPNGADAQCAHGRRGVLCGACQQNLSLSLGSSLCLPCESHWPAMFVAILIAAIIAGILLVAALLALNMTVAVGLINIFIFYANVVAPSSTVFFPSSEPSFPSVFVAWLNLDIGIDVCFFDGLDTYTKTWLQLAFPVYIISLVVLIIKVSQYSPRFVRLIGKKDPIATLATLILLSYAKLLSVTITALSFAVLHYPDGTRETVWLPDGNVAYFQGKHIPLVLVALLIVLIGIPYTLLLLLWQWLVRAPKWIIFKWIRNTKLNGFIATYHSPYNSRYRYWTGLLLLVRVVLYAIASITVSSNPQSLPLVTIVLIGGLFLLSKIVGSRIYKKSLVDSVDTVLYFNLLALAAFSLYNFKTDILKQTAVSYTSALITSLLLVGAIIYHVVLLINKNKVVKESDVNPSVSAQPVKAEVTHSIVELTTLPPPEYKGNE